MPYLDYNSTTPVDRRVLDSMLPVFSDCFGNPSSQHGTGRQAADLVEDARKRVAAAVGMRPSDVVFTSGATEANNLALAGLAERGRPKIGIRMLAGSTEHKSVLQTCRALDGIGHSLVQVPVDAEGRVDLDSLESQMREGAEIVSLMAANSETGVIHPVREIAGLATKHGVLFHCDATQAIGRIHFNAGRLGVDMLTLSSHKVYGPKGCGALVATREARKRLGAIIHGGGQENDLRSGTHNAPAIVGFGTACEIAVSEGLQDAPRQRGLRDAFEKRLAESVPDISINGGGAERLPNTSNVRISGALADAVLNRAARVEASTGSACSSNTIEPSHVLTAMGLDRNAADECLRISVGRETEAADVEAAVADMAQAVSFVRGMEERAARPHVQGRS